MDDTKFGDRITDNALTADNGQELIKKALDYIKSNLGWFPMDQNVLFRGLYYDSKKVGSYIIKVQNDNKESAILKLQLKPLPFDEGYIIRYIDKNNKSKKIKTPHIISDVAWNEKLGFGYILFKDISTLNNLWIKNISTEDDRNLHKNFLKEFLNKTLPIKPWFEKPDLSLKDAYKRTFEHFEKIANQSSYHHIRKEVVKEYKDKYYESIHIIKFDDVHFTHAHLSGKDIKYNPVDKSFTMMANLYWSYRPKYYELIFPMWVDIMHLRDKRLVLDDVLERIKQWGNQWQNDLYDHNPTKTTQYWFNLLERAMMTLMLDLGASEWKKGEEDEKQALLNVWQELFMWIVKNKF
jgi:hypothetical protein